MSQEQGFKYVLTLDSEALKTSEEAQLQDIITKNGILSDYPYENEESIKRQINADFLQREWTINGKKPTENEINLPAFKKYIPHHQQIYITKNLIDLSFPLEYIVTGTNFNNIRIINDKEIYVTAGIRSLCFKSTDGDSVFMVPGICQVTFKLTEQGLEFQTIESSNTALHHIISNKIEGKTLEELTSEAMKEETPNSLRHYYEDIAGFFLTSDAKNIYGSNYLAKLQQFYFEAVQYLFQHGLIDAKNPLENLIKVKEKIKAESDDFTVEKLLFMAGFGGDGRKGNPNAEKKDIFSEKFNDVLWAVAGGEPLNKLNMIEDFFKVIIENNNNLYTHTGHVPFGLTETQKQHIDILKKTYLEIVTENIDKPAVKEAAQKAGGVVDYNTGVGASIGKATGTRKAINKLLDIQAADRARFESIKELVALVDVDGTLIGADGEPNLALINAFKNQGITQVILFSSSDANGILGQVDQNATRADAITLLEKHGIEVVETIITYTPEFEINKPLGAYYKDSCAPLENKLTEYHNKEANRDLLLTRNFRDADKAYIALNEGEEEASKQKVNTVKYTQEEYKGGKERMLRHALSRLPDGSHVMIFDDKPEVHNAAKAVSKETLLEERGIVLTSVPVKMPVYAKIKSLERKIAKAQSEEIGALNTQKNEAEKIYQDAQQENKETYEKAIEEHKAPSPENSAQKFLKQSWRDLVDFINRYEEMNSDKKREGVFTETDLPILYLNFKDAVDRYIRYADISESNAIATISSLLTRTQPVKPPATAFNKLLNVKDTFKDAVLSLDTPMVNGIIQEAINRSAKEPDAIADAQEAKQHYNILNKLLRPNGKPANPFYSRKSLTNIFKAKEAYEKIADISIDQIVDYLIYLADTQPADTTSTIAGFFLKERLTTKILGGRNFIAEILEKPALLDKLLTANTSAFKDIVIEVKNSTYAREAEAQALIADYDAEKQANQEREKAEQAKADAAAQKMQTCVAATKEIINKEFQDKLINIITSTKTNLPSESVIKAFCTDINKRLEADESLKGGIYTLLCSEFGKKDNNSSDFFEALEKIEFPKEGYTADAKQNNIDPSIAIQAGGGH